MTEPGDLDRRVADVLARAPHVAAVVVTGSYAHGTASTGSDLDLFVYVDGPVGDWRHRLADELADPTAPVLLDVDPFGSGDVWRSPDGTWVDLVFWPVAWAEDQLDRVLVRNEASLGYSTAFWRSIASAVPVHERDGWHPSLQRRASAPYPDALVDAIVRLNTPWLDDHPFSFLRQVEKAVARGDAVSVNHRAAAWLASFFDVLFALNRVLHPGEKRVLEHAMAECPSLPHGLADDVGAVVGASDPVDLMRVMLARLSAVADEVS